MPPLPPRHPVQTHFVANSSGILVPVATPVPIRPRGPDQQSKDPGLVRMLRKIYLCPACKERFPVPEPDPQTNFKANFSCHVLLKHLRPEVESRLGTDEVCSVDLCEFNIVQLKEDGVPDAEKFLIKHYMQKHMDLLQPILQEHPLYAPESCMKTISVVKANTQSQAGGAAAAKTAGMPNTKLKPIFLDKYNKFAKNVAHCSDIADCDPMHIVVFLSQWTSRRNYSVAGIKTLIQWISEVMKGPEGWKEYSKDEKKYIHD